MNKIFASALALTFGSTLTIGVVVAAETAKTEKVTPQEAVAMVKKGVDYIKTKGRDKAFAAINDKEERQFHDRELYLTVFSPDGVSRAHGANPRNVGKNQFGLKDVDGKLIVEERLKLAETNETFWQDFKFTNPVTKNVEPKRMYCERTKDPIGILIVCGGIYKP